MNNDIFEARIKQGDQMGVSYHSPDKNDSDLSQSDTNKNENNYTKSRNPGAIKLSQVCHGLDVENVKGMRENRL